MSRVDRLAVIEAHYEEYAAVGSARFFWSQDDIAWLIGEVKELRAERDTLAQDLAEIRARGGA